MSLSQALLWFAVLVGGAVGLVALALVPTLFVPFVFPMFKLFGQSAAIATALAVAGFAMIPLHAYAISAVTGVLRAGGDVAYATALDLLPQWVICLPITALCALVLKSGYWSIAIATALAVAGFVTIPLHAYAISAVTGVLRAGGDVAFSTALDLGPQWLLCLPVTALCALVLKTGAWPIAFAIQLECIVKSPLCAWRIGSVKWIHDVTRGYET